MSRFAGLKQTAAAKAAPSLAAVPDAPRSGIAKARAAAKRRERKMDRQALGMAHS